MTAYKIWNTQTLPDNTGFLKSYVVWDLRWKKCADGSQKLQMLRGVLESRGDSEYKSSWHDVTEDGSGELDFSG